MSSGKLYGYFSSLPRLSPFLVGVLNYFRIPASESHLMLHIYCTLSIVIPLLRGEEGRVGTPHTPHRGCKGTGPLITPLMLAPEPQYSRSRYSLRQCRLVLQIQCFRYRYQNQLSTLLNGREPFLGVNLP